MYVAGLALAGFMAFISVLQFYFNAGDAINQFVSSEYQSLFQAGFNLIVLLASGLAISVFVRRLGSGSGDEQTGSEQTSDSSWGSEDPVEMDPEPSNQEGDSTEDSDHVQEVDLDEEADTEPRTDTESTSDTAATDWDGSSGG